jgi:GR25 family glycosyltransferase involved in LPS biosynthesis
MKAYVINLATRLDRWKSVISQSDRLGMECIRIDAVSISDDSVINQLFVTAGVAATWKSHQRAMYTFLESGDNYGLILEDDFLLEDGYADAIMSPSKSADYDFIQLGYLKTSPFDAIACKSANITDLFLKFLAFSSKINLRFLKKLSNKVLVSEQARIPYRLVMNDIRAGGHSYVVSRKFAAAAQEMNYPVFISTDGYFMSLGGMRTFSMCRLRKSVVSQSNSPSSVSKRFISHGRLN